MQWGVRWLDCHRHLHVELGPVTVGGLEMPALHPGRSVPPVGTVQGAWGQLPLLEVVQYPNRQAVLVPEGKLFGPHHAGPGVSKFCGATF